MLLSGYQSSSRSRPSKHVHLGYVHPSALNPVHGYDQHRATREMGLLVHYSVFEGIARYVRQQDFMVNESQNNERTHIPLAVMILDFLTVLQFYNFFKGYR